jgi:ABC-type branched-subunit amino acid transport system ATPase component
MAEPRLLLVDESSLGLMPKMVDLCLDALMKLKDEGQSEGQAREVIKTGVRNGVLVRREYTNPETRKESWASM